VNFTLEELKTIMKTMQEHGVTELSLQGDQDQITLKREHPPLPAIASFQSVAQPMTSMLPQSMAPALSPLTGATPAAQINPAAANKRYITSPMVGSFYSRPSPDKPPYLSVGDQVSSGQVICIVEAMKVMNEVKTQESGRVVSVLVKDGQIVEFGTKLYEIE
jgi:acetyl-CoA carboxylase biotin carboxyl carrier protein